MCKLTDYGAGQSFQRKEQQSELLIQGRTDFFHAGYAKF